MMTKKERELLEYWKVRAKIHKALRWTNPVEPDLPIPESGYVNGWRYNSYRDGRVYPAWSAHNSHHDGDFYEQWKSAKVSSSQRGVSLYSTKVLALQALRAELEEEYAKNLARIDKMIEEENAD